jgi:hypothetical protein
MKKKIISIILCMVLITITFPIVETIPISTSKSDLIQKPDRLLFLGYSSGKSLVLWGANGYPGETVGEPEYGTNDSKGFFLFPLTGLKGKDLNPSEEYNITEAWDIEKVRTKPFILIRWKHEGEKHRLFARFSKDDDTDFQYLRINMTNPFWESQSCFGGLNIEWIAESENYTNLSNLFFKGRYDGKKISGRANCMVFYNSDEDNGFILVNLIIENLDNLVCFGWSNLDWTPWDEMSKRMKAHFKII